MADRSTIAVNVGLVVPSDTGNIGTPGTLRIGGAGSGNLKITTVEGTTVAYAGVTAGEWIPVSVAKVWSTGTDVTNIVVHY